MKRMSASAWSKPLSGPGFAASCSLQSFIRPSPRLRTTLRRDQSRRPSWLQNYAGSWQSVLKTGVLAEPWSTETCFSRVDYRDVAEVAAIALIENRLTFGTFELCAEGNLNRKEVAALIADVLGRRIDAAKVLLDAPAATPEDSPKARQMAAMKPMFDWYDRHSLLGSALTLRAILGREPRTLRAYFKELAGTA